MKRLFIKNKNAGFTLAETLITILILMMVTLISAVGISVAVRGYNRVLDTANAQLLLSSTVTRLREELSTAVWAELTDGDLVMYYNGDKGFNSELIVDETSSSGKGIKIRYSARAGALVPEEPVSLVPKVTLSEKGKQDQELYAAYDSITFDNGVFKVKNLCVKRSDRTEPVVTMKEGGADGYLYIVPIAKPEIKATAVGP